MLTQFYLCASWGCRPLSEDLPSKSHLLTLALGVLSWAAPKWPIKPWRLMVVIASSSLCGHTVCLSLCCLVFWPNARARELRNNDTHHRCCEKRFHRHQFSLFHKPIYLTNTPFFEPATNSISLSPNESFSKTGPQGLYAPGWWSHIRWRP